MLIEVYCRDCEEIDSNEEVEQVLMPTQGDLMFNPETRSQAQNYECPKCSAIVTIVIHPN